MIILVIKYPTIYDILVHSLLINFTANLLDFSEFKLFRSNLPRYIYSFRVFYHRTVQHLIRTVMESVVEPTFL